MDQKKEKPKLSSYVLKIPFDLWQEVKILALKKRMTTREFLTELLDEEVKKDKKESVMLIPA